VCTHDEPLFPGNGEVGMCQRCGVLVKRIVIGLAEAIGYGLAA
jgi:hypothetical protein